MAARRSRGDGRAGGGNTAAWLVPLLLATLAIAGLVAFQRGYERSHPARQEGAATGRSGTGALPDRGRAAEEPPPETRPSARKDAESGGGARERPGTGPTGRAKEPAATRPTGQAKEPGATRPTGPAKKPPVAAPTDRAPEPPATRPGAEKGPRIAIVIDDIGWNLELAQELAAIDLPVTWAVLPRLAFSTQAAGLARAAGRCLILHQPMEPENGALDSGPGTIRTGMKEREVRRVLEENLRSVPHATGLNNHEGSRATADTALMRAVLREARRRGLFFLDSRTTPRTVAEEEARHLAVPTTRRDVFLDEDRDPAAIAARLDALLEKARSEGVAVGIGHLVPETLAVLRERADALRSGEVRVVPLAEVVK